MIDFIADFSQNMMFRLAVVPCQNKISLNNFSVLF